MARAKKKAKVEPSFRSMVSSMDLPIGLPVHTCSSCGAQSTDAVGLVRKTPQGDEKFTVCWDCFPDFYDAARAVSDTE